MPECETNILATGTTARYSEHLVVGPWFLMFSQPKLSKPQTDSSMWTHHLQESQGWML